MPKELRDTTADGSKRKNLQKKYGHDDWYGWAVENWSTKWDIHEFYGGVLIETILMMMNQKYHLDLILLGHHQLVLMKSS